MQRIVKHRSQLSLSIFACTVFTLLEQCESGVFFALFFFLSHARYSCNRVAFINFRNKLQTIRNTCQL